MMKIRCERGQGAVIMAMSLACFCGVTGFALDLGTLFHDKRILQTAADTGAIAATAEVNYGDATAAAKAATALNGITDGSNGATVTVNTPPLSGPNTGKSGYVEVIVAQSEPTYFMKIFSISTMTVKARAVGANGPGSGCVYTLGTTGTDLSLTGSGSISIPDCGILDDSSSNSALTSTGSGSISAQSIGLVGKYTETGSGTISPTPSEGMVPASNPLAFLTPPTYSSCNPDPHFTGSSSNTIGPAVAGGTICYNGLSMTGSGSLTMNPGIYVINGSFSNTGSGSISGTGITVYLTPPSGSLSLTGSGSLNLKAPTTGTYNGILFYEDASDTQTMSMTGSGSANIQGIFYAPAAAMSMTGSGSGSLYADFVVKSMSMTGSGTFHNYADVNANSPIAAPKVVE